MEMYGKAFFPLFFQASETVRSNYVSVLSPHPGAELLKGDNTAGLRGLYCYDFFAVCLLSE